MVSYESEQVPHNGSNLPAVSQFTLLAATDKGNKPDFHRAASVEHAREMYDRFVEKVKELHSPGMVKNGVFQAMMEGQSLGGSIRVDGAQLTQRVHIQNSGPVGVEYSSLDEVVFRQALVVSF